MAELKIGDYVSRKSYKGDIYFKIVDIKKNLKDNLCLLKGVYHRIQADADESDLTLLNEKQVLDYIARYDEVVKRKCNSNIKV